ncbi:uncharacterized protein LOC100764284 isoform X2 [Cricetulus griseus]|uniref:uncharacterized protein LOC100764284 isoform X2 n=1 Tax=Cricetulus griseus TaxID=10029 RepID=UPI0007DAA4FB|nr:uncharacterized protein LOC100764284 isoform X2 [Cricetulus griseus]
MLTMETDGLSSLVLGSAANQVDRGVPMRLLAHTSELGEGDWDTSIRAAGLYWSWRLGVKAVGTLELWSIQLQTGSLLGQEHFPWEAGHLCPGWEEQAIMHTWNPCRLFTVPSAASPWLQGWFLPLQKQACRMWGSLSQAGVGDICRKILSSPVEEPGPCWASSSSPQGFPDPPAASSKSTKVLGL